MAGDDPPLVTRHVGLSSTARHRGFAPAVRSLVEKANILRYNLFGLIAVY
jgi:hypothetical protein